MTTRDEQPETISRQRYEAVVAERDQYKTQASELGNTVKDLTYQGKARDFFASANVEDPSHWADIALPHLRGAEPDEIPTILESKFGAIPTMAPTEPTEPPADPPPAPTENVRPAVGGPNPAAEGATPAKSTEKLSTASPEFQAIFKREGFDGMRKLIDEGRLEFAPQNDIGQRLTQ